MKKRNLKLNSMALEIKIPSPGESITEVELASWFVEDGALVSKNQEVGEIESEKATLPLIAEQSGKIKILVKEGETVNVGTVVASIDTSVEVPDKPGAVEPESVSVPEIVPRDKKSSEKEPPIKKGEIPGSTSFSAIKTTPVAREMMEKEGLSVEDIINGLKKITASDVKLVMNASSSSRVPQQRLVATRDEERKKVSQLRKKISERLVAVKNDTAMLTTFNEADMSAIMVMRKKHQDKFVERHGIKLGFMSFFTKAVTEALKRFPSVNSFLDGEEVVSPGIMTFASQSRQTKD